MKSFQSFPTINAAAGRGAEDKSLSSLGNREKHEDDNGPDQKKKEFFALLDPLFREAIDDGSGRKKVQGRNWTGKL